MENKDTNQLKSAIIDCGLDRELAKARNQIFREDNHTAMEELEAVYGSELLRVADNLNIARRKRKKRVQKHCHNFVTSGMAIFVTLTFRDDVLAKTSSKTRRRYVSRYLLSQSLRYVANIDFGNDGKKRKYNDDHGNERMSTAREHYHAVVVASSIDCLAWKYGKVDVERVGTKTGDSEAVAKYVAKLTNHAMKENGGIAPRLIYSRCFYGSDKGIKDARLIANMLVESKYEW